MICSFDAEYLMMNAPRRHRRLMLLFLECQLGLHKFDPGLLSMNEQKLYMAYLINDMAMN